MSRRCILATAQELQQRHGEAAPGRADEDELTSSPAELEVTAGHVSNDGFLPAVTEPL